MIDVSLSRRAGALICSAALLLTLSACGEPGAEVTPSSAPTPSISPSGTPAAEYSAPPVDVTAPPSDVTSEPTPEPFVFTYNGLEDKVASTLDKIIEDGMTDLEKCEAVYQYTWNNIGYTGDSDKSDWEMGAYVGLTAKRGDCFTYYAVARAMLSYLGIPNLTVTRDGGVSDHYWLLVDFGYGWYHFDSTPRSSKMPAFDSFMFTDAGAADYTEATGEREYYKFDDTDLPERATVELKDLDLSIAEFPATNQEG